MDPRKKWIEEAGVKKRKSKKKPAPHTIPLPTNFWPPLAPTLSYGDPYEIQIENLIRRTRGIREMNENFRDEINDILEIDIAQGAHNRQSRINRGNQIIRQIQRNDETLDELQIVMDRINEDFADISSTPRR